ncbi:MAG: pyridoxamine 5'-phosphate oxidase family protein [Thiohalocapsa sp.]
MAETTHTAIEDARRLWYGSFDGVISTQSLAVPGYPFGSVVPLCLDQTGRPLLLLSHLAQHSRNLAADPRCALTLFERPAGDIQQGRRLTCVADCHAYANADALTRYCRHFPNGRVYAEQLGFRLYRLEPLRFHYNGGFATARWLGADRLLAAAIDQAEPRT